MRVKCKIGNKLHQNRTSRLHTQTNAREWDSLTERKKILNWTLTFKAQSTTKIISGRVTELDGELVSKLVCALSPVNHKGLHQGWTQTSLYLKVIQSTSHHTTSHVFRAYLYSVGTQHGNLHPARWPILFCGPTQEPCVSQSRHRKNRERFWKNADEWTGRVDISKEEIPGSKHSMYGYILTYSRL